MFQNINQKFNSFFSEGVQDKGIFKAVFLVGSPGSGKDYVLRNALSGTGLVEIPLDKLQKKSTGSPKNLAELKHQLVLDGRNGLIINDTGEDHQKIKKTKKQLESLGYSCAMVLVYTDDETSRKRNNERYQKGARAIPENTRKQRWESFQESRREYSRMFSNLLFEFDNSLDLRTADPQTIMSTKQSIQEIKEKITEWIAAIPETPKSQQWIETEVNKLLQEPIKKNSEKLPNSKSAAFQQASELGLRYLGNGKYGKDSKVTHYVVNDTLQEIKEKTLKESVEVLETKPRKTLASFRESIDKGIELGLSMATSGEGQPRHVSSRKKKESPLEHSESGK